MTSWRRRLQIDPIPVLVGSGHPAIQYHLDRDLLEQGDTPPTSLWSLPEAAALCRRQKPDGRWAYPGKPARPRDLEDYDQIETYRVLRILVEKYAFDRRHPSIQACAGYLFARQTDQGDFRGIYGQQYSPNYSAGIIELLIKSGFQDEARIQLGFEWLLALRQEDGGWAIPLRTVSLDLRQMYELDEPLQPQRSQPFSHLVTGMVLRAFAAHPVWKGSDAAGRAAVLLSERLFTPDAYVDRRSPEYWMRVSFPFWFTDILSALDSLTVIANPGTLPAVRAAIERLSQLQVADGSFDLKIVRGSDKKDKYWIVLAISRIFKRFFEY